MVGSLKGVMIRGKRCVVWRGAYLADSLTSVHSDLYCPSDVNWGLMKSRIST